jgi:hypothetical protein
MERITVSFSGETYEKIAKRADTKQMKVAAYVRQLVELGLRIEEMSEQKSSENQTKDPLEKSLQLLQKLLQKEFTSNQETLYLVRYILTNIAEKNTGDHAKMLDAAKVKAQTILEVILEENAAS